jgi:hypothetical protein
VFVIFNNVSFRADLVKLVQTFRGSAVSYETEVTLHDNTVIKVHEKHDVVMTAIMEVISKISGES